MLQEDFATLSRISRAFWPDRILSNAHSSETLSAVTLLDLPDEIALERMVKALLEKANRLGASANTSSLDHPFYRLIPEERLVLAALHHGHWSYARVGRVLDLDSNQVAKLAWSARLRLSANRIGKKQVSYPIGTKLKSLTCPEYDPQAPWTQKFMDEELSKREQLFLQNHMMACESCRRSLSYCRDLYYAVDSILPVPKHDEEENERSSQVLFRLWQKTNRMAHSRQLTLGETFGRFFSRREIYMPVFVVFMTWIFLKLF